MVWFLTQRLTCFFIILGLATLTHCMSTSRIRVRYRLVPSPDAPSSPDPSLNNRRQTGLFLIWAATTSTNLCFVSTQTLQPIDLSRNGLIRFYSFWILWRAPAIFVVFIGCRLKRFMGFYGCSPTFLHLSGMLFCTIKLVSVKIASTICFRMLWKQVCSSRHLLRLNLNNACLSAN